MKKSYDLSVTDLNPIQQYTLQLQAKNENGWSEPSKQLKYILPHHLATPQKVRVSSKEHIH